MDNQNNQNQQNGYNNFNNYQPTTEQQPVDPAQQTAQPNGQQPIPQGYVPQTPYQVQPVKDNSTLLGVFSIILGFISLFVCPYVLAAGAIALGISGRNKNKKSVVCLIGIILAAVSLVINIIYTVYMAMHPEIAQQTTQQLLDLFQ